LHASEQKLHFNPFNPTDSFLFQGQTNFLGHIPAMLNLTFLTKSHSSHAESDIFDRHIPAMLSLTFFTTAHSSHAESDAFYDNTFRPL
jgi:hypothetical protein